MTKIKNLCEYNCLEAKKCPLTSAMQVIGGKWKIPIICALSNGPVRYNALLKNITGITNTMLASSLKELEKDGLVKRTQYLEMPVRVEYSLTEKCDPLRNALSILREWGAENFLN